MAGGGARQERRERRRGDPPRLGQGGKRKLNESARKFPKTFPLAESGRGLVEEGLGATGLPNHWVNKYRFGVLASEDFVQDF